MRGNLQNFSLKNPDIIQFGMGDFFADMSAGIDIGWIYSELYG